MITLWSTFAPDSSIISRAFITYFQSVNWYSLPYDARFSRWTHFHLAQYLLITGRKVSCVKCIPLIDYINIHISLPTPEKKHAFEMFYKFNNGVLQAICDSNLCQTEISYKSLKSNDIISNLHRFNQARPINFKFGTVVGIPH